MFHAILFLIQLPISMEDLIEIAKIIAIIVAVIVIDRIALRRLKTLAKILHVSVETLKGLRLFIRFLILAIALVALSTVKWFPAASLAGAGALVAAVLGFASATAISNFLYGAYVLISRIVGIGDYIRFDGEEGIVIDMTINYTKIKRPDGSIMLISNKDISTKRIINFRVEEDGRTYFVYPIEFSTDVKIPISEINALIERIKLELEKNVLDVKLQVLRITKSEIKYAILLKVTDAKIIPEARNKTHTIIAQWLTGRRS